jgi:hypothetical protein
MPDFAISTEHLTRRFGGLTAVDDIHLQVAAGQFFGFLGANGSAAERRAARVPRTGALRQSSPSLQPLIIRRSRRPDRSGRRRGDSAENGAACGTQTQLRSPLSSVFLLAAGRARCFWGSLFWR